MRKIILALPMLLISFQPAFALDTSASGTTAKIDDLTAIRCVLGEYEGTLEQMQAVAESLFNRGYTKGVYGCKAVSFDHKKKMIDHGAFKRGKRAIPAYVVKDAIKAVKLGRSSNLVKGASFWESTDFKRPYWAKNMVKTATIGKHEYFRAMSK